MQPAQHRIDPVHALRMVEYQRLALLGVVHKDRKPIVMVAPVALAAHAKLPEHVAHHVVERDVLPLANDRDARLVRQRRAVEHVELVRRIEPAVLLKQHGLVDLELRLAVVFDPLRAPRRALAPPVRVRVEGPEVHLGHRELGVEVPAVGARIRPVRVPGLVELALAAPGHHVARVDALDEPAHLADPVPDHVVVAGGAVGAGQVADAVGAAAGLVGELPGEDGGRVLVAADDGADVVLEGRDDLAVVEEVVVVLAA